MNLGQLVKSFTGMATGLGLLTGTAGTAFAEAQTQSDTPGINNIEQVQKLDGGKAVADGNYLVFKDDKGETRHISVPDLLKYSSQGKVPLVIEHQKIPVEIKRDRINVNILRP